MGILRRFLNATFLTVSLGLAAAGPATADSARASDLLDEWQKPDLPNWKQVEDAIWTEWSKSGSPSMDLLLKRGREALEAGDIDTAIAHLTALADHAPDFAEAYNVRAIAYFKAKLFGPAIADLVRALELNPQHFGALTGLGTIFEETGRYDDALEAFRAARAIQPHDPDLQEAVTRLEILTSGRTL